MGVNIFESRKVGKLYTRLYFAMTSEHEKHMFSQRLRDLFDKKSVSEEGEYEKFKITEADVVKAAMELHI